LLITDSEIQNLSGKHSTLLTCQKHDEDFFSNVVAFSVNLDFNNEKLQKYLVKLFVHENSNATSKDVFNPL
jgi:hypothetical protein